MLIKGRKLLSSMVVASVMAGSASVVMAEETLPAYDLEATVVTATKNSERLLNVPAAVEVVTAKEIAEHNYKTVSEAISSLTGVYMSPRPESGMGGNLSIRGFEDKDILVLLDGMPMNDTYNNSVSWDTLPMQNISKIEVAKGSASALYGGRAVGAVVQIFTKDQNLAKGEVKVNTSNKYGTHHTWQNKIDVQAGVTDKLTVGVGFEKRSSDGYPNYYIAKTYDKNLGKKPMPYDGKLPYSPAVNKYLIGTRGDKGYDNRNYSINVNYKIDDHQQLKYNYWHVNYKYFYRNPETFVYDAQGKPLYSGVLGIGDKTITISPKDFLGYEGYRISNTHVLNYQDSKNHWQANLGIVKEKYNGYNTAYLPKSINHTGAGEISDHPGRTINFDINKTWTNLGKHEVLVGGSYKEEKMTQVRRRLTNWKDKESIDTNLPNAGITALYGGKSKNTALYIQDKVQINEPVTMYLGLRYDKFTKTDGYTINYDLKKKKGNNLSYPATSYSQLSPKLAVEYKAKDNTHYYVSYGHSFNPPPLYQIYRDGGGGMGKVIANPQLIPEKTDSYEIGLKKDVNKRTQIAFDLFKAKTKDKIFYKSFMKDGEVEYKQYVNGDQEKRQGMELSVRHKFSDKYSGYLNYTNQRGKLISNGQEEKDYNIPRHLLHTGFDYKLAKFKANLDLTYASSRQSPRIPTGSYGSEDSVLLVNTAFNYKFNDRASMQFGINNLFNRQFYAEQVVDGRNYNLGLNYNF